MIDPARKILRIHFPNATDEKIEEATKYFFPAFILGGGGHMVDAIDRKDQVQRIENIRRLSRELWREFNGLHSSVRRRVGGDLWNRTLQISYDLTGENPQPWLTDTFGKSLYPRKRAALDIMSENIDRAFHLHHNQRIFEFSLKVHLVQCTRETWENLTGKPAPRKAIKGAYFNFVAATVTFCGKQDNWDSIERVLAAWCTFDEA